jgi:uncharacterized protein (TIGR00661 family)
MKILYGVVGEGMGHATRSKVILDELCRHGHEITVVVSGRAHAFLENAFSGRSNVSVEQIHGFTLEFDHNELDLSESILNNLKTALPGLFKNVEVYREIAERRFKPDVVISDFESFAHVYGALHRIPVISIDNMQVLNRCEHDEDIRAGNRFSFELAKWTVKAKVPHAYHYLASSFFFPKVSKKQTTLIPPILRNEIYAAKRERGSHVLVYQSGGADQRLVDILGMLPPEIRFYGKHEGGELGGNIVMRPFSESGFVDDLRTARAVIATGGYSLMGEAVHLGVPMLARPLQGQFEQEMNSLYLRKLGYGDLAHELSKEALEDFLGRCEVFEEALATYPRQTDNGMLFRCLNELLEKVRQGCPPPNHLQSPAMGTCSE